MRYWRNQIWAVYASEIQPGPRWVEISGGMFDAIMRGEPYWGE